MLENLRRMGAGQEPPGAAAARQTMRGMQNLMQRQQQLLDRSFRAEEQRAQPDGMGSGERPDGVAPGGGERLGAAANEQEALRRALGEMMRRLGEGTGDIPNPLGRAERAMKNAAEALRAGEPGGAIGPQTEALEQLQQAARQLAQEMQQQLLGQRGSGPLSPGEGSADQVRRDPLGRPLPTSGAYDEGDVKIPAWNTLERSRAILDELRRRAGETDRPTLELQYIDRLLQQF
jgi:HAMP domain-containing protein